MRIVVLGGGFAGTEAVRVLERRLRHRSDVEILLVSDRNYLLFTPLLPQDPETRRCGLTVCVVGGGYTGVKLIAELKDLFHSDIVPRYRDIDPGDYRLLLVEASAEILRGVHPTLAERARRTLWREGIEIRTGTRVTRVLQGEVEVAGGERIPVGLTVWAAGVVGNPALARVDAEHDRLGRLLTRPTMQLKLHPDVYGAGDAVAVDGQPEASVPIIPAALAHARLAAENIVAELEDRPLGTIEFAPQGMLVALGERDAVVDVLGLHFSGFVAWLFWNALHLWKLVGFRKQLQVAVDWGLVPLFPRDTATTRRPSRCLVYAHHPPAARQPGAAA
jgi:NADH:quinone reductase (non-electrogenic)